ncbi:MAG: sigma-70 family RNA polymerase sigma factor [Pseudomonadales bacterium]|nr:sigma-70 family RNA polymerase sigma factor [Pseudomonadales bacterium]
MSEHGLPNNPQVTTAELAALHDSVWHWARSLVGDRTVADDVVQRAYVEIVAGTAHFDGRSQLKTWLYDVVRNVARSHLRTAQRELALVRDYANSAEHQPSSEQIRNQSEEPTLAHAIAALPSRQKEVLELVVYREFTLEQSAQIIGISVGTVRTHYHRAKEAVGKWLEQGGVND